MYKGKHMHRRKRSANQKLTVLVSVLLIMMVSIGATLAFLAAESNDVVNVFEPGKVPPTINEPEWNGVVKKNVTVTNNGNVPAYIRAAISVSWQKTIMDNQGNLIETQIAPDAPVLGTDYTMTIKANTHWVKGIDGYYYYTVPVAAEDNAETAADEDTTDVLIENAQWIKAREDGYQLVIDVLAQTIQADGTIDGTENGTPVVADIWGYKNGAGDGSVISVGTNGVLSIQSAVQGG